jgi:hypothetical protein
MKHRVSLPAEQGVDRDAVAVRKMSNEDLALICGQFVQSLLQPLTCSIDSGSRYACTNSKNTSCKMSSASDALRTRALINAVNYCAAVTNRLTQRLSPPVTLRRRAVHSQACAVTCRWYD